MDHSICRECQYPVMFGQLLSFQQYSRVQSIESIVNYSGCHIDNFQVFIIAHKQFIFPRTILQVLYLTIEFSREQLIYTRIFIPVDNTPQVKHLQIPIDARYTYFLLAHTFDARHSAFEHFLQVHDRVTHPQVKQLQF